jgi:hypothetical protein
MFLSMLNAGLLEEVPALDGTPAVLRVTAVGFEAIRPEPTRRCTSMPPLQAHRTAEAEKGRRAPEAPLSP